MVLSGNVSSFYLRQGGYVIVVVCLSVCLSVSNFAQKNFRTDLHEIFREGWLPMNKRLNFGADPNHGSEFGSAS